MVNLFPISKKSYNKVLEELKLLKFVLRKKIIRELSEARMHGDLSENAEYKASKERQNFIESKISVLESIIAQSRIIDIYTTNIKTIQYGSLVQLLDLKLIKTFTYKITSIYESSSNTISIFSPLSQVLINKRINQFFKFSSIKKVKYYKILFISYNE